MKKPPITRDVAERASRMRQAGSPWRDVESATGFGRSGLRKRLAALGLPYVYSRRYAPEQRQAIVDLRVGGVEWKRIARRIGRNVDRTSLRKVFVAEITRFPDMNVGPNKQERRHDRFA